MMFEKSAMSKDDESREALLNEGELPKRSKSHKLSWLLLLPVGLVIVLSNIATFLATLSAIHSRDHYVPGDDLDSRWGGANRAKHVHKFPPFDVDEVNNFTTHDYDVADASWRDIGTRYQFFVLPWSQAEEFDLTTNHVTVRAGPATGDGGYAVNMDALHQLHCVNLLRQSTWYNFQYYTERGPAFQDTDDAVQVHVNHCINMLRELVMCRADNDIIPYYWLDQSAHTIPDFARKKTCRDFEGLRSWADAHQTFLPDDYEWTVPEGVKFYNEILHSESQG